LTGRLTGQLQGRSVSISAFEQTLAIELEHLASLWTLFSLRRTLLPLQNLFSQFGGQAEVRYKNYCIYRKKAVSR
jgi:hypothetical protein